MLEYIIGALIALIGISIYLLFYLKTTDTCESKPVTPLETPSAPKDASGACVKNTQKSEELVPPYATDSIQSVDDYEYNMVFKNEGDRAMTRATRDLLMSQYPMDWTVQPPSSDVFQQGLASYKESFTTQELPVNNPYKAIDGKNMTPPVNIDEKDILATYTPKKPNELTTYDAADAGELIDKIYGAKGLVADYKKTGENTFTILSTRPKDQKIVYEDEESSMPNAQASTEAVPSMDEGTYDVPANIENYKTPDPFYTVNPSNRTRDGKWDYSSWTPGLERMFAPTEPQTKWY